MTNFFLGPVLVATLLLLEPSNLVMDIEKIAAAALCLGRVYNCYSHIIEKT